MKIGTIYGYMTQCFDLRDRIKAQKQACHRYKLFNWVDEDDVTKRIEQQIKNDERKLERLLDVEI